MITFEKLSTLRDAIERFATSVAASRKYADASAVAVRLAAEQLNGPAFIGHWGQAARSPKRHRR